jgi:DhnA family fructose-bisphosphate aldolase class Ia
VSSQDFSPSDYLPRDVLSRITDLRVSDPRRVEAAAARRRRRDSLTSDGRLSLLAADHPARRVTAVGSEPLAMADRHDYLARIVRILLGGAVDGVMSTMDILEDLLLLGELLRDAGGPAFLDRKLLIASLNRGGLAGTSWELDDPMTGADAETVRRFALDGGKLLLRIGDDDPGSLRTMVACAESISRLNDLGLPTFLEPLPVERGPKGLKVLKEAGALARAAGVASALGSSSRYLWLKLPYCDGYEQVARSTTLPILLLGGESAGDPLPFLHAVANALAAGSAVRGALVGRNVLYPGNRDPLVVARAVDGIIHRGWSEEQAAQSLDAPDNGVGGGELDAVTRWLS